jgi:ribulose 1,5-bisphosphate carboxylase large subunit-like protein
MRRVLWVLAFVVGGFFILRAVMELFVVDFGDPSSYAADWGGPSLFGVLLVHMGPGVVSAVLLVYAVRRARRRRALDASEA